MNSSAQNCNNIGSATAVNLGAPLNIGGIQIPNRFFLAPMSGVTDLPFRNRASAAGAGMVVSEMVASQEFVKGSHESQMRAERGVAQYHMVQLAGRDAYWMGEAARLLEQGGADIIDINMGCPAKKVTGGYSGSALMRDLDHALTLIEATVQAVNVPVTLKMRLGWDDKTMNSPQLARRAESAGVQMITVHGRTRCQFYTGAADWAAVRAVRDAVSVPLVVNGDIQNLGDASSAINASGADAVMAGRAHYGQPWLAGLLAWEASGQNRSSPRPDNLLDYVIEHHREMVDHYGPNAGVRHSRKHLASYIERWVPHANSAIKATLLRSTDVNHVHELLSQLFNSHAEVLQVKGIAA